MTEQRRSMEMEVFTRETVIKGRYRITIAANEKARQGPDLVLAGIDFSNYLRNPNVMWAHDTMGQTPSGGLPIGRTLSMETKNGHLQADFEFLEGDEFAARVKNAWDRGFLRAASISWLPIESEPNKDGSGFIDIKSELLEWSLVSIPSDPDALRSAHMRVMADMIENIQPPVPVLTEERVQDIVYRALNEEHVAEADRVAQVDIREALAALCEQLRKE